MITAEQVNAHIEKLEAELQGATTGHARAKAWKACAKKWRANAEHYNQEAESYAEEAAKYKKAWQEWCFINSGLEMKLEAARKVIEVARNVYTVQRALAEYDAAVKQ